MRLLILSLFVLASFLLMSCAEEGSNEIPVTTPATWADVSTVFSTSGCNGCHPTGDTDLAYTPLMADNTTTCGTAAVQVTPNDRNASCLYLAVTGTDGMDMSAYAGVNASVIGSWIDNNAMGP